MSADQTTMTVVIFDRITREVVTTCGPMTAAEAERLTQTMQRRYPSVDLDWEEVR